MSSPVRAHLISLSLVLGLTVSLVWGQAPTHFTLSGVTVTGPISITSVGSGTVESPSLLCRTTSLTNTVNTVWLFPDGSLITQVATDVIATDSFIFRRVPTSNYVVLRRGPSVRSPGGDYCCGSDTNVNERLCINLVVDCDTPPSISNGSPGTPTNTQSGGTVIYTCSNGYEISPGVTMATVCCLATGNWETVPTCLVDCRSPPSILNGSLETPTSTLLGGMVTYTCNNGYEISPGVIMATASCLATGNWQTITCSVIDCGPLTDPADGTVTTPSGTTFINNATATYNCTTGYNLTGDMTRTCGSDGMWTLAEPTCPPVDCGSLTAPLNGGVDIPVTTFMNTATYSCNTGYNLTGSSSRTCESNGMWTPAEPSCPPVDCGPLTAPTNGGVTTPSGTTLMNTASYSCNTGYNLTGSSTRTCESNGMWTPAEPSCPLVDCGSLTAPRNGTVDVPVTTIMNTATYSCHTGYILTGDMTRTCGFDGMWTPAEPTCISIRVVPSAGDPPTAGQSYSLTCTVTGTDSLNLTISYQWTRGFTTVGTNPILTFDPLVLSDTGQYRCEVTLSSNLLSENIKVVSDMFDLAIPTVFIQILFRGIHNCPEYRQTNANGIIQDVTNGLVEAIQDVCGCGLTSNHVSKSFLQCFSDSPEQIAFRAQLNQTTHATTEELVSYIDQWVRNLGRLIVQGSLLQLNTTCSLVITDQFVSSECPTTRATETLPSSAPPSCQCDNTGAIVGACAVVVILGLILAVTAVIIAYLVLKQRRMGGVDLKTPDIPLTHRSQSSTVQTYDTVDVTYEEVDVPKPQKGSYEYSQCQAYAPTSGGGVVTDVEIHGAPVTST